MKIIFKNNRHHRASERGNVLIFIFLAIALFAALSFTVSDIMRSGSPNMLGDQQAYLYADELLDYAQNLRLTVQDLKISNGCSDEDISFSRSAGDLYEHTPAASDTCKVFHPSGGGMNYVRPNDSALDSSFSAKYQYGELYISGSNEVVDIGTDCAADRCMELVLFVPYIKDIVCQKINERFDITSSDPIPEEDIVGFWPAEEFKGVYADAGVDRVIGDDAPEVAGFSTGCVFNSDPSTLPFFPTNFFYQVLIGR